ncbi:MAG TPA: hypothetical protein VGH36_02710 [Acetobacteraceae bacterium]|jgi:hypothetical protein
MIIDPLGPRYHLQVKATTRADPTGFRYEIWEKLDAPWLILASGRYATEQEAWDGGRAALRRIVDEPAT